MDDIYEELIEKIDEIKLKIEEVDILSNLE